MAKFTVVRTVDACVVYEACVEAETPEQAAELAQNNEDAYAWGTGDCIEYDARRFVSLDAKGLEIENSARGDW